MKTDGGPPECCQTEQTHFGPTLHLCVGPLSLALLLVRKDIQKYPTVHNPDWLTCCACVKPLPVFCWATTVTSWPTLLLMGSTCSNWQLTAYRVSAFTLREFVVQISRNHQESIFFLFWFGPRSDCHSKFKFSAYLIGIWSDLSSVNSKKTTWNLFQATLICGLKSYSY